LHGSENSRVVTIVIVVKFRNSKKNVLKIVLIIVNINKDENKSLISNQFFLKYDRNSKKMYLKLF
jgi:hypothetical protein